MITNETKSKIWIRQKRELKTTNFDLQTPPLTQRSKLLIHECLVRMPLMLQQLPFHFLPLHPTNKHFKLSFNLILSEQRQEHEELYSWRQDSNYFNAAFPVISMPTRWSSDVWRRFGEGSATWTLCCCCSQVWEAEEICGWVKMLNESWFHKIAKGSWRGIRVQTWRCHCHTLWTSRIANDYTRNERYVTEICEFCTIDSYKVCR